MVLPHEFLINVKSPTPPFTEFFLTVMVPSPAGFPGFSIKGRVNTWLDTIWGPVERKRWSRSQAAREKKISG